MSDSPPLPPSAPPVASHGEPALPLSSRAGGSLRGEAQLPGDKSMSHRALILGLLAVGETRVTGLLEGEDVLRTAEACRALGAEVVREEPGAWRVHGRGVGGLVALCLTDVLSDGLSMVYSFYDPELAHRSLGTFLILDHIAQVRSARLNYVYLGYWVKDSPKMAYKAQFQPLEVQKGPLGWCLLNAV